jgi:hypothetical protein
VRSASLEGSRGHAAPVPAPPTEPFNALTTAGARRPSDASGDISRHCSTNPPGEVIPATVRHCAVRPVSAPRHCATRSRTAGAPHPWKGTTEPSKGDKRLFRARTGPRRDVGRVPSVTISPVRPSPPSRRYPGHCSAIPDAVEARDDRRSSLPLLCPVRPPVSGTLESARGRPPNGRPLHRHPRSRSWTDTGHATTSHRKQDSPGRPSTPRHCTPRHRT